MASGVIKDNTRAMLQRGQFFTVNSSASKTIELGGSFRGMLTGITSAAANCGVYCLFSTGSGAAGYRAIASSGILTIDTSTSNYITLTVSSGSMVFSLETFSGTMPII